MVENVAPTSLQVMGNDLTLRRPTFHSPKELAVRCSELLFTSVGSMSFARPSLATQVLTSVNLYIHYFVIGPLKASARVAIKLGIMLLQTGYKYQVYNHQS